MIQPSFRRKRGSTLLTTTGLMFTGLTMSFVVVSTQMAETHKANRLRKQAQAFALAEAGVEYAHRWLQDRTYPPSGNYTINITNAPIELEGGTFTVQLVPQVANNGRALKTYTIRSTGTVAGTSQAVDVAMQLQSFGKFAYFSDKESASPSSPIWFGNRDKIRGPFFTNNADGTPTYIHNVSLTHPIFESTFEMVRPTVNYYTTEPATDEEFLEIFALGRSAVSLNVEPVSLPATTNEQQNAAWGGSTGQPTAQGVYVPDSGGIYVVGDCRIELSVENNTTQEIDILQGWTRTEVQINYETGITRIRRGWDAPTYRNNLGTGVLYCSGNITELEGEVADSYVPSFEGMVRSALTIVADADSGKRITISDDIEYRTPPREDEDPYSDTNLQAGVLGIYANQVRIGSSAGSNVRVDGAIFAASSSRTDGGFGADNYQSRHPGELTLYGGLIQKVRGAVGTFNGNTQVSGFRKDYHYDHRLMDNPPPVFPTTGKFDRIHWTRH